MVSDAPEKRSSRGRAWLNLIWALPVALGCSYPLYFLSGIWWCGVYGCNPSADSIDKEPVISIAFLVVGGAISALPFILIPWTTRQRLRSVIAASYALLYVVMILGIRLLDPWYWR